MFKKCSVIAVLCVMYFGAHAQKTAAYLDKDALYKQGIDLFDKKQFVAAQKSFSDYIDSRYPTSLLQIDAEYYAAACAIELFHKDGEWRMREFINRHPESNKINGAYFYLGKSSFRKKKYDETIKNLEQVDIYKLTKDDLAELYFKRGYSYLETNQQEKAKADFYEIKDVDNKYAHPANYYYSHIAYKEKKYDLALQGFQRLLNNETFGAVVPYYITQIYFVQGKYEEVVKDAPSLLNDSNHVQKANEIYRMIGESYYNLKDYRKAIDYLKKTSGLGREGSYALGYCYYKLNDCANAIPELEKVTDEKDSLAQNAWYHLGDCYIKTGEKTKARNAFYSAYTVNYDKKITEDALFSFAKLCYELDFSPFNEAVRAFSKYLKEYPNSSRKDECYRYLINVYSTTKSYDQAISSIESLETIDPILKTTYAKLVYFRGVEYFNNSDYDNASKYFKKALAINADKTVNALATYWQGEISYQRKDYSTALETWKNFQLLPGTIGLPEYNKVHYSMGYAYFQRKEKEDYTNANIAFRKFLMAGMDDVMRNADANVRAADCYFMKKEYGQASELYETAIALNKIDVDYSIYQKALCNGLIKNYKEKISDLKSIESKFPNSNYLSAAIFEIAETYDKDLNDADNAIIYYDKIIKNFPKSSFYGHAMANMGLVYYGKKDDDKAFWYFDQIVKKDPRSEDSREVLPMIKKIFQAKGDVDGMEKYFAAIGNPLSVSEIEKELYASIGDIYYNAKNCDESMPKMESYISKFPEGKYINEVQYIYGECAYNKSMFDKALSAYQFIIGKSRSIYSETAYSRVAYLLFKDKKYAEALPVYLQMQEISETPANKLTARIGAMRCAFYQNQYETALTESNKVLATDKINPQQTSEAKYIKAKSLFETQRYDDAIAEFRNIAKTAKNVTGAEAHYYIARIHFQKKEYKETERAVNELISYEYSTDDWNTSGMLLMADVYIEKGDDKDAEIILQTIIDGKPKQEFIDEANKRLEQIKQRRDARLKEEQSKQQELNIEFKTPQSDKSLFENQNTQPNTAKPEEPK